MSVIRVITLWETEASSEEDFQKHRVPPPSQIQIKIYTGWVKHSSGLCLVDSRVSSFWETTRAVTRNEKIWNCHLYLRSLCKSFYQILEITMLLELHKSPSLQKTALMQSRRKTQHLSLEHQAFSLFSSTRDEENWLDRESKSTDSNFTYHPPHASKNKKGTIRLEREENIFDTLNLFLSMETHHGAHNSHKICVSTTVELVQVESEI